MLNPSVNGNPETMETQRSADARFIGGCKRRFPGIRGRTIEDVTAELESSALNILKTEIRTDPENRGYNRKTLSQVASLVSDSYTVKEWQDITVLDITVNREFDIRRASRIFIIWNGIPNVPNRVTSDDVKKALR